MELKEQLLNLNMVEESQYLDKYCELIISNENTHYEKGKTHKHHIIPKSYYKLNKTSVDNASSNIVNLLYKDHILAHYYLALCSLNIDFKYANELAFMYLTQNNKYPISENEQDIINSLPHYQELYEEGSKIRSIKNKGKKRTTETREKMSIQQKGKPKSEEAKKHMSEAQKGRKRSSEEILHWKESWARKTPEEKKLIAEKIRSKTKGRIVSDEERLCKSLALKDKPKSAEHKKKLSDSAKLRYGEKSNHSKLKESQVVEVLTMLKNGVMSKDIANAYNVSIGCIYDIKHQRSWKYLIDIYPDLYDTPSKKADKKVSAEVGDAYDNI